MARAARALAKPRHLAMLKGTRKAGYGFPDARGQKTARLVPFSGWSPIESPLARQELSAVSAATHWLRFDGARRLNPQREACSPRRCGLGPYGSLFRMRPKVLLQSPTLLPLTDETSVFQAMSVAVLHMLAIWIGCTWEHFRRAIESFGPNRAHLRGMRVSRSTAMTPWTDRCAGFV